MGGNGSKPEETEEPEVEDTRDQNGGDKDSALADILERNTYYPGNGSKYPYFLVQLNERGEKQFGEDDLYVSDAICNYVRDNDITHIIAQTHGWNTPPDKAVAVPFTEFMGGMQNDCAMPTEEDGFKPMFVAFIWPAVPYSFMQSDDALTRAQLLADNEREQMDGEDTAIAKAADAARKAMEEDNPDDEELNESLKVLVDEAHEDDDDEDDDEEANLYREGGTDEVVNRAKDTPTGNAIETVLTVFRPVMRPFENLMFGRLMKRGQRVGHVMGAVLGKLMRAAEERSGQVKVSMMANSLGAHVLAGAMKKAPEEMPYKLHTVFFVQGAITREWFGEGRKYGAVANNCAGPVACSYSSRDLMLKNIYGPFHGTAIGFEGSGVGKALDMKSLELLNDEPYEFDCCAWNDVNCSEYIDEGNPVAGGHGDFKEDETTSLYWSMIKCDVDEGGYSW